MLMPSVHEIEGAFKNFGSYITSIASKPKGRTVITKEIEDRSLYHLYNFKTKSSQCHYVMTLCGYKSDVMTLRAFGFEALEVIQAPVMKHDMDFMQL